MKDSTTKDRIFTGLTVILIWQILYNFVDVEIFKVSPLSVLQNIYVNVLTREFYLDIFYTLTFTLCGIILGILIAILLTYLSYKSTFIMELSKTLVMIFKAVPIVSFIVFFLFFVSSKYLNIFTASIVSLQIVFTNIMEGLRNIDGDYLFMAKMYRAKKYLIFKYIYMDHLMTYLKAALSVAIGMAFKASVAAEVISHPEHGLGTRIYESKIYLDLNELLTFSIFTVLISYLVEKIVLRCLDARD
ncbi:ABC transporter permease subunit [Peptoniphilus duerdenii]|uniref:ABC transporter permease subunit n=1 Tax=Peptoniphilus duerdenii TaxID=507750 RepID=UPI00288A88D6|nr:ABC transporter permease subunit [Peptoniphilus duerdenii]